MANIEELEIIRSQVETAVTQLLSPVPPRGEFKYRSIVFNNPMSPIERWARKFPQESRITQMLANDSARILVDSNDEFEAKPWLGLKFWAQSIRYPASKRIIMALRYGLGDNTARRVYKVSLEEGQQPTIKIDGETNSFMGGTQHFKPQKTDADVDDLMFISSILQKETANS